MYQRSHFSRMRSLTRLSIVVWNKSLVCPKISPLHCTPQFSSMRPRLGPVYLYRLPSVLHISFMDPSMLFTTLLSLPPPPPPPPRSEPAACGLINIQSLFALSATFPPPCQSQSDRLSLGYLWHIWWCPETVSSPGEMAPGLLSPRRGPGGHSARCTRELPLYNPTWCPGLVRRLFIDTPFCYLFYSVRAVP